MNSKSEQLNTDELEWARHHLLLVDIDARLLKLESEETIEANEAESSSKVGAGSAEINNNWIEHQERKSK